MSPERYQRVCELFHAACDLPRAERDPFLEEATDDSELRAEVNAMLAQDNGDDDAVSGAAIGFGRHLVNGIDVGATDSSGAPIPDSIGPFKIIRKLGEGGMGVVYEAAQTKPQRRVALKVLRPRFASGQMLRRFQHEVEIQARLNHAGIGHVYEAGIETTPYGDQPYFSMELVDGRPITRYAREAQLDVNQRLGLMIDVCDAVQHAHDHGIVHRDLKPANIVVQANGKPKVLDFGIARVTDSDKQLTTMQTAAGQLLGTIPYMSPEQISGTGPGLDHRSDLYSLGVLLYELLADQLPFDLTTCSIPQAALIIQDDDPPRLSSINIAYRGEIETVVMTALEKSPDRRYQSAQALADDLRRILSREPVSVSPPSTAYQLKRFAKRNKPLVGGVLATILALVVGIIGVARYAYREYQQRYRAEQAHALAQAQTYRVSVAAASHALEDQNVLAARRLLNEAPEEHRGWEWHYLKNRLDASVRTWRSEHASVNALTFIANGRQLLARSRQSYVRWDVQQGEIVDVFPGSLDLHAAVSPDNTCFAFLDNGRAVVRDIAADAVYAIENVPGDIRRFAISRNNDLLALATADGGFDIRQIANDKPVSSVSTGEVLTMSWSPQRDILAARTATELILINVANDMAVTRIDRPAIVQASVMQWSPAGCVLYLSDVLEAPHTGNIVRYDVATMSMLSPLVGHARRAEEFKFFDNGNRLVSSSHDGTARLWDTGDGQSLGVFEIEYGSAFSGTLSPDGSLLALGNSVGTVRVFNADLGTRVATLVGHESPVLSIAFSQDGKDVVAGAADGSIRFWRTEQLMRHDVLMGHTSYVYPVVTSADGQWLASAGWDGTVRVWDINSGQQRRVINGHARPVYFVNFDKSGEKIVSYGHRGRRDNEVIVDDLKTGQQYSALNERQRPGMAPAFHEDGMRVWLPRTPGATIRLWSYENNEFEDAPFAELQRVQSRLIHHESSRVLLIAGESQTALVVDIKTGKVLHRLIDYAMTARWSPNGAQVVIVHRNSVDEANGDRISVWNAITGEYRGQLLAHVGDVFDACYSSDGLRIFTCGRDEQIRIWDAATLSHLIALSGHTEYVWSLAFNPTGNVLVSGSGDKTIRLWRTGNTNGWQEE